MEVDQLAIVLENGFKDVAARLNTLEERVANTNGQITEIRADQVRSNLRLIKLDDRVVTLTGRVGGVDERMARVEERVVGVDEHMARVEERVAGVDDHVVRVEERVAGVDVRVHQTKILVEQLTDDVKQIAEGVQMHHKQLGRHIEDTDRRFDEIESVFRNYRAAGRKRTTARAK